VFGRDAGLYCAARSTKNPLQDRPKRVDIVKAPTMQGPWRGTLLSFLELLKAVFLGVVEGITEWLPISSTGHMILVEEFIRLDASDAFKEMFFVVIQLGAILAVVMLYFHKLNPFSPAKTPAEKKETMAIWYKVAVGVLPAAVVGFLF